jgi:Ca2+-binding RTX toxin-like protein
MADRRVPATYPTIAAAVAASATGDTVVVAAGYAGGESVTVTVDNLLFDVPSGVAGIVLTADAGVATIRLAGGSSITVVDNDAANVIVGNAGDNLFHAGAGNDQLDGGAGYDTVSYAFASRAVAVDLLAGTASGPQIGSDVLLNIEGVTGTFFADTITGNGADNLVQAGEGADTVDGGAGNDRLYGNDGDDHLQGGDGQDLLVGGRGNDQLDGGAGLDAASYEDSTSGVTVDLLNGTASDGFGTTDTLTSIEAVYGSSQADTLILGNTGGYAYGRGGDDTITGGNGDDEIYGGAGSDHIDGGAGTDTVNYFDDGNNGFDPLRSIGVKVDLLAGTARDNGRSTDTLIGIENVTGSSLADSLAGDNGANVLNGGAGDDKLVGNGGGDALYGGDGTDVMQGGDGDDSLIGGSGDDRLDGGAGRDVAVYADAAAAVTVDLLAGTAVDGRGGTDTLVRIESAIGGRFGDTIRLGKVAGSAYGRAGDDVLTGGSGDDELNGGSGADTLNGGAGGIDTANYLDDGFDTAGPGTRGVTVDLSAGTARDSWRNSDILVGIENVVGSAFDDLITGGDGRNRLSGGLGDDRLNGGAGNDELAGGSGDDKLNGDDGDDRLSGGAGNDQLIGGNGLDAAVYETAAGTVTVNLLTRTASDGLGGSDTLKDIEGAIGGRFGDTLILGKVSGYAYGRGGDDSLVGGIGNDELIGGSGADAIDGGAGIDTVSYLDDGLDSAGPALGNVTVNLATGTATDGWGNIDTLVGIENVTGSSLRDTIVGDGGSNLLRGGRGIDSLYGGDGDDALSGGWDSDVLDGGAGFDVVLYDDAIRGVTVNLLTRVATDDSGGTDSLIDVEGVVGSQYADTLVLGAVRGIAVGRAGDDTLTGGAEGDALHGGSGKDKIDGGGGIDTVVYLDDGLDGVGVSLGGVTVDLGRNRATDNWGNTDKLANVENVVGSSFGDSLAGNTAANLLEGLAGNDRLDGKDGADVLKGGDGEDTFAFTTTLGLGNVDAILDFVSGIDHIELGKSAFRALDPGVLPDIAFIQAAAAVTADQHILYDATTGTLSYDADGSGARAAIVFAVLAPGQTLTAGDFKVV